MNPRRVLSAALLAAASAAVLPGQSLYPTADLVVPFTPGNWTFGRSVTAMLSGHGIPDVVVLATQPGQETAMVASAPALYCTAHVLANTAGMAIRDVAVLPDADPRDGRDALALSTDSGLWLWTFGGGKVHLGGSNWNNATLIRTGRADTDDVADVVGRMGNPHNLRCQPLGPGTATWFVDTGADVLDFVLTDWCASASGTRDEIIVAQADRIRFVVDGQVEAQRDVPLPLCSDVHLAVLDDANGEKRLVVCYTDESGGASWLMTLPAAGGVPTLQAIGAGVAGMSVGGKSNPAQVVITWLESAAPTVYTFLGAPTGFDGGAALPIAPGASVPGATARWTDLDGDGDLDAIAAANDRGGLVMHLDPTAIDRVDFNHQTRTPPAWATHIEVAYYQIDVVHMQPDRLRLQSHSLGTAHVDAMASLYVLRYGSLATGPVAVVLRYVRMENGVVTRRGGSTPYIYAIAIGGLSLVEEMVEAMDPGMPHPMTSAVLYEYQEVPLSPPQYGQAGGVVPPPKLPPPDDDDPPDAGG